MHLTALADWLAESGLRNLPLEEMVDGLSRRLNDLGVPVARTFVGMNTLHPMVRARSMIWDRATGLGQRFEFGHGEIDAPIVRESPFTPMLRDGIAERRCRVDDPAIAREAPLFEELHAAGMTEWLGRVFPIGELMPRIGGPHEAEHAERLWLVCSVTTDRPGGYRDFDLAVLTQVLPLFALAVKAVTLRTSAMDCWRPISAPIRRAASSPAPCSAARCRASRPSSSSPTCAASPRWPMSRPARS